MKQIFDEDSANLAHTENKQVQEWEQSERKRILKITNPQKKQIAWKSLFPKTTYSPEIESMVW